MENLVTIIHVIACLGVIGLVLMQHGKGADMGAAFGSGSSGSLFGVSGSSNFLSRTTAIFVLVFFLTSISLAFIAVKISTGSVVKELSHQKCKIS
jgi:protein translocase, SecG subunit